MNHQELQRIPAIDALKGLCALIIAFVYHYRHFGQDSAVSTFFELGHDYGYLLVDLFFTLSGFGIALGYQDKILNHEISFVSYIKKRLARFYPTHLITLLLVLIFQGLFFGENGSFFIYQNNDAEHFFFNLLLLQNGVFGTEWSFNAPSWCLSIFVICYVVFFGIICYKSTSVKYLIGKCIIVCVVGLLFIVGSSYPIMNSQIGRGLAGFSIGIILFNLYKNRDKVRGVSEISFVILFFLFIGLSVCPQIFQNVHPLTLQYVVVVFVVPLTVVAFCFNRKMNFLFSNIFFRTLGKLSFCIYLWHFPVQCIVKCLDSMFALNIDYSSTFIWGMYCLLTIGISALDPFFSSKCNKMFSDSFNLFRNISKK